MGYPDLEKFAYSFSRAELTIARTIVTAISNVSFSQPTTEGVVMGTRPWPLLRTEGNMGIGTGTVTFTDEDERMNFLTIKLGEGFRTKIWGLTWFLSSPGRPNHKMTCYGCRSLEEPIAHAQGDEALGGDVNFSFMGFRFNGKNPHLGMPSAA